MAGVTSRECEWHKWELRIFGRPIIGLRGFEYGKKVEKEHLYGAGKDPIDIQEGNVAPEGSLKVLGYERDQLNDAAILAGFDGLTDVPADLITLTITYRKSPTDKLRKVSVVGVSFTEDKNSMDQGAKYREVTLPFLAMKIVSL